MPALAAEAREDFEIAAADAALARAVAIGRTQLELGAMRPDTALAVIDAALPRRVGEARQTLLALREEAQLASHALPWEGPSALATYHVRRHSQAHRAAASSRRAGGWVCRRCRRRADRSGSARSRFRAPRPPERYAVRGR